MGTNLIRAMLLASVSVSVTAVVAPTAAYAQEASYQIDIPAQPMDDALRALGKATKQNIVFSGKAVRGKRSVAVRGRMTVSEALSRILAGSGLKMSPSAGGFMVQGGNADAAPARTEASATTSNVVAVPSASASTVVDARTGAALKGALVEIVETGEKTSTGELGEFRFPGKNGSFNLRISYLGYPQYEQYVELRDGRAASGILLSDGSATGEIIVTAYQSARAQALNQERTAENSSTVISDDLTGKFDGTTISEALRRASGVSFVPDTATGDGTNVIVRGLAPDFNTVTLNGLRLPVGDGINRSANLGNILADSVSKITINKTLLPNQDGSGTGGLVEIETKGPLDRPKRYFNVVAEHALSARSFLNEDFLSGTASFKLGSGNNFGISLSAQYRDRRIDNVSFGHNGLSFGQYLPATQDGDPVFSTSDIDPRRIFPFEEGVDERYPFDINVDQGASRVKNLALAGSAEWQIGNHTNLRFDYVRNQATTDGFSRALSISPLAGYEALPINQSGEVRQALVWENFGGEPGLGLYANQSYTVRENIKNISESFSFRGKTQLSNLELTYKLGRARGRSSDPGSFLMVLETLGYPSVVLDRSELLPQIAGNLVDGRVVSVFAPSDGRGIQFPGIGASGYATLNDPNSYFFSYGTTNASSGSNKRDTASLDLKYEMPSPIIKYVQAGFFFERSTNRSDNLGSSEYFTASSVSDLGLDFTDGVLQRVGRNENIRVLSRENLFNFYRSAVGGTNPLLDSFFYEPSEFSLLEATREDDLAGYFQTFLQFGRLEIIGGARFERVKTRAQTEFGAVIFSETGQFDQPFYEANRGIADLRGSDTTILPRVVANMRFNKNLVLRAGYYLSIARPSIRQLSSAKSVTLDLRPRYGPALNQPQLTVNQGNPNLRAATTDNLDLSLEWYSDDIGAIKAAVFYKPTQKAFFSVGTVRTEGFEDIELPDDPRFDTPNLYSVLITPENDTALAKLWGAEFSLERKLAFLPAPFDRLGIYANYTYTDSERVRQFSFAGAPSGVVFVKMPYASQPKHSGTFALTYSSRAVDASLSYSTQSRYGTTYAEFGQANFQNSVNSLDFRLQYQTALAGANVRLYVEGANLLKGPADPNLTRSVGSYVGAAPSYNIQENYLGGRSIRFGISGSF